MIWIRILLLVAGLTTSVSGISDVKTTSYQAEEDGSVTFSWDGRTRTGVFLTDVTCLFQSDAVKVVYKRIGGVVRPQHRQFAGRVRCDEDALRDGRFRLRVSGVKPQDSGYYWCDVAATDGKSERGWGWETTEHFLLSVTARGESSGELVTTPSPEDVPHAPEELKKEVTSHWTIVQTAFGYLPIGIMASIFLLVMVACLYHQADELRLLDREPLLVSNV